ncbi:hypothetical protein CY0110_17542 [Crocosphaera chwakensis CCY0110]|uniref:Uncharacterized protein n=1 Tax=Crocosphaera chwakensis CCY0110 TaxID=391612 RepID=A3IIJ0_9CHRO|nr:hypothetical protein CY0110_17542 [Crocosphaera chwakensis CCY0110]
MLKFLLILLIKPFPYSHNLT